LTVTIAYCEEMFPGSVVDVRIYNTDVLIFFVNIRDKALLGFMSKLETKRRSVLWLWDFRRTTNCRSTNVLLLKLLGIRAYHQ
jgi:hypothetical protein